MLTTLKNTDKQILFVGVDTYYALETSSEFMRKCHTINIIVQTTGGDTSSLNGKQGSPNNTLDNIKRALLMNSSNKKKHLCLDYKYSIWISYLTDNMFHGDVPELLWHGSRPSYKQTKIWGVIFYIINGNVTRKNLDNRSHHDYFMEYAATTEVII